MKSDSTKKSVAKSRDKTKDSETKNLKKEINEDPIIVDLVIPEKDVYKNFDNLELKEYPNYLDKLLKQSDWMTKNEVINLLKNNFEKKFNLIQEKKKIEFKNGGGNEIDFNFSPPYKKEFYDLFKSYRKKKNQHFKEILNKQNSNLSRKKEIIEEIKYLIDKSRHDNNTYKKFRNLQEAFHGTGHVPRKESNNIWQTYKFHVERFYDLLHLNRELRDVDYQNNYKEKIKLIEKVEKLVDAENIYQSIRELNNLHRQWKNELGPVARDKREELWKRFQEATKKIHERKNKYNKNIDSIRHENYKYKIELIDQINKVSEKKLDTHVEWQDSIKMVEELKKKFLGLGDVPRDKNKNLWNSFRNSTRAFNKQKNDFYKNLKILEKKSIETKEKLINEVDEILIKDDWVNYIERIRQIQNEWKNSGRISKRNSQKLWSEFKLKTNKYFQKVKNKGKDLDRNGKKIIKEQKIFLDNLKKEKIPLTPKKYQAFLIQKSQMWSEIRNNDIGNQEKLIINFLSEKWNEVSIPKSTLELKKYETKLLFIQDEKQSLKAEHILLKKKIDNVASELNQLENNLEFFSESSSNNPLLIEVNKKIEKLNNDKFILETKLKHIKSFLKQKLDENGNQ